MPALCCCGIQLDVCRSRLSNPAAAEQSRAVVKHRSLARRDAKFRVGEAHPFAIARCSNRRRQRSYLHADVALVLAEPVPVGDTHRLDSERMTRSHDDPGLFRLHPNHIQRLLLAADLDPAPLADRKMDDSTVSA